MSQSNDFPVGYKKPPLHARFKPGQSGNPRGRPKKASVGLELLIELNRKVTVRENGVEQKLSKAAALAKSLVARALAGDMRAIGHLIGLLPAQFRAPPDQGDAPFAATDAAALERFVERRLASINEVTNPKPELETPNSKKDSNDE